MMKKLPYMNVLPNNPLSNMVTVTAVILGGRRYYLTTPFI